MACGQTVHSFPRRIAWNSSVRCHCILPRQSTAPQPIQSSVWISRLSPALFFPLRCWRISCKLFSLADTEHLPPYSLPLLLLVGARCLFHRRRQNRSVFRLLDASLEFRITAFEKLKERNLGRMLRLQAHLHFRRCCFVLDYFHLTILPSFYFVILKLPRRFLRNSSPHRPATCFCLAPRSAS